MRFYTVEKLGPKQSLTPEGFLLCEDVPIARTGIMIYGPNEVPVTAGKDGLIRISREEDEVFRPEHVASYAGKPAVNDHPQEDVVPENWRKYAVGTVLNPRRGTGLQADLLVADIVVTVPDAIKAVREGKTEVSCGYDADYVEVSPGVGRQVNLVGNHVALVDAGRCGPRCAIKDQSIGDESMKVRDESALGKVMKAVRDAFAAKDETAFNKALDEATNLAKVNDEGIAIHLHAGGPAGSTVTTGGGSDAEAEEEERKKKEAEAKDRRGMSDAEKEEYEGFKKEMKDGMKSIADAVANLSKRMGADAEGEKAIEGELEEEAPAGTGDRARKARDSNFLADSFQATASAAEILTPGIHIPAFDVAAEPKKTLDAITKLRRDALGFFYNTPQGRGVVEDLLAGKPLELEKMSTKDTRELFRSAMVAQKNINNAGVRRTGDITGAAAVAAGAKRPMSLADLNKANADFYAGKAA